MNLLFHHLTSHPVRNLMINEESKWKVDNKTLMLIIGRLEWFTIDVARVPVQDTWEARSQVEDK